MRSLLPILALLTASTALAGFGAGPSTPDVAAPDVVRERLVSTNLPADEILLSLLPPERLLAVSSFARDPHISNVAALARRVGDVARPGNGDVERIVAMSPAAVVLFPFMRPESRELLARCHVPVISLPIAESLEAVEASVLGLGARVGEPEGARELVDEMRERLSDVDARAAERPSVLYFTRGYTAGRGTLIGELIERAGGRNAAAEAGVEGHARLDAEHILAIDPDYILLAPWRADARERSTSGDLAVTRDPLLIRTRAVRRGHVLFVPPSHLMSTSHFVARAVQDIARQLRHAEPRRRP
ncbi:MAG: ABC transporter substrate-binding protein [Deltaproteobacteria bacterium]|nr:ABC transporter substrate-binding protein [Deltaproteobacteria bacterium]